MNQAELIAAFSDAAGINKTEAEHVLKTLGEVVADALNNGGEITLPGIGKLTRKHKEARKGRNPSNGTTIDIAAKNSAGFKAAKTLTDKLNGK